MYLIIFKNGIIRKTFNLTDELRKACIDGDLSVVDISNGVNPVDLFQGEWIDIEMIN